MDPCSKKIAELIEDVKKKGERRTTYLNLAWTGPIDNSFLQANISLGKVRNMAADMFLHNLPTGETAETAPSSEEAVPDAEVEPQGNVERRAVEILTEKKKKPWQIPTRVEKGYEIPITVTMSFVLPVPGKWKRLHMDIVVNAVWLAYYWSREEKTRRLQQRSRA